MTIDSKLIERIEGMSRDERFTLEWLSKEDFSLLGECEGAALTSLVQSGLAMIGPMPAGSTDPSYRLVSVTDEGHQVAAALRSRSSS